MPIHDLILYTLRCIQLVHKLAQMKYGRRDGGRELLT
jgi:hypothetical protein